MSEHPQPVTKLWEEYRRPFTAFDDLSLGRWLAQTLGQFEGQVWRMSHPLVGAYRAAAEVANERQIWLKRLASAPASFPPAECCRSPLLPLFTRDVLNSGLLCQHCGGTAIEWADLPGVLRGSIESWANEYGQLHAVAHYEDEQMRVLDDYEETLEQAATSAEISLRKLAREILPGFLEYYPALLWEDQDECLDVEPSDIATWE